MKVFPPGPRSRTPGQRGSRRGVDLDDGHQRDLDTASFLPHLLQRKKGPGGGVGKDWGKLHSEWYRSRGRINWSSCQRNTRRLAPFAFGGIV